MPILTILRMRLPVCPVHSAVADAIGEAGHFVEHRVDFRHDVPAVHNNGSPLRRAQGDVQHRAVFRNVDLVAPEHGINGRPQAGFLRQFKEQPERFVGNAVLRIIEKKARGLGGHALSAPGVGGEKFAEMQRLDFFAMGRERLPGVAFGKRFHMLESLSDLSDFPQQKKPGFWPGLRV